MDYKIDIPARRSRSSCGARAGSRLATSKFIYLFFFPASPHSRPKLPRESPQIVQNTSKIELQEASWGDFGLKWGRGKGEGKVQKGKLQSQTPSESPRGRRI